MPNTYVNGNKIKSMVYNGQTVRKLHKGVQLIWAKNEYDQILADIGGYIRYADKTFNNDGSTTSNRIAVCAVEPNTTYIIEIHMDNRFRMASYKGTPANKTVMDNLACYTLDYNNSNSQNGGYHSMEYTTGNNHNRLFIGYWSNTGKLSYQPIKNSIYVYKKY